MTLTLYTWRGPFSVYHDVSWWLLRGNALTYRDITGEHTIRLGSEIVGITDTSPVVYHTQPARR